MKKELIKDPYMNGWSGPQFPINSGAYLRLTRKELLLVLASYDMAPFLWICTSKFYCFIRVLDAIRLRNSSYSELENDFRYYNCSNSTGRYVKYWLQIPYNSYNEYNEISKEYYSEVNISEIFNNHAVPKIKGA